MQAFLLVLLALFAVSSAFKPSFLLRSSAKSITTMKMVSTDVLKIMKTSFTTAVDLPDLPDLPALPAIDLTYNVDQPNAIVTVAAGIFLATAIMGSLQAVLSQLADGDFYGKKKAIETTQAPKGKGRK